MSAILIAAVMGWVVVPQEPLLRGLTVSVTAPRQEISTGEAVRIDVTLSTTARIHVRESRLHLSIDDGRGPARWSETPAVYHSELEMSRELVPGRPFRLSYVVGVTGPESGSYRLAFPTPGEYTIMAVYRHDASSVTSAPVVIRVTSPTGEEARLWNEHIRRKPILLSAHSRLVGDTALEALFGEFGARGYLARARLLYLERKLDEAVRNAPDPVPPSAPVQGDVPHLLATLAAEDFGATGFDLDRLLVLARTQDRTGRRAEAATRWREILERYPVGAAADEARRRLRLPPS